MNGQDARAALDFHMRANGYNFASLSRLLGRNPTYIQQYVRRGVPRTLEGADLRRIARHLGIAPALIGESEHKGPQVAAHPSEATAPTDLVCIPAPDPAASPFGIAFHAG